MPHSIPDLAQDVKGNNLVEGKAKPSARGLGYAILLKEDNSMSETLTIAAQLAKRRLVTMTPEQRTAIATKASHATKRYKRKIRRGKSGGRP